MALDLRGWFEAMRGDEEPGVGDETTGWFGSTGEDRASMTEEEQEQEQHRQIAEEALGRRPVAEVRVRLLSLSDGEAEIEVAIDPEGELAAAYGEGEEREEAYQRLYDVVQRELGDALRILAEG